MKRLTRKIGLCGGPAAMISSTGKKRSVSAGSAPTADSRPAAGTGTDTDRPPHRWGWLRRLLLGNEDAN